MIINLRESKARLSELVELASHGEEILITVLGKPKARLTRIDGHDRPDMRQWHEELLRLQTLYSTGAHGASVESLLDIDRQEREL